MNAINLLDSVIVTPQEDSALEIHEYAGKKGVVFAKTGEDLAVVFDHDIALCLTVSEVRRVAGWDEHMDERTALSRGGVRR